MGPTICEGALSLSWIYTAPVPIVLSTDTPTHMEPSFISAKCKFWVKNTVMYGPQKPFAKILSSVVITFCITITCTVSYGLS